MRVPAAAAWRSLLCAVLLVPAIALAESHASAAGTTASVKGADISWPNCPEGMGIPSRRSSGEPMPTTGMAGQAEDPLAVFNLADQVRETIQQGLHDLLKIRGDRTG